MTREDIESFVDVGKTYTFGDGQIEIVGSVIKISESAVIIQKKDGLKRMLSIENIQTIDEDIESATNEYHILSKDKVSFDEEQMKEASNSVLDITAYSGNMSTVELSPYILSLISSVDFKKYAKMSLLDEKLIETGSFSGNREEAEKSIEALKEYLNDNYKKEISGEFYLTMAKIAYDSSKKYEVPKDFVMSLLGAALVELGDQKIVDSREIDSARSYYIEALKILPDNNDKNHIKASNMLVYSFFTTLTDLQEEIKKREVSECIYLSKYYSNVVENQDNIREFIIATFMLYNNESKASKTVDLIRKSIEETPKLLDGVETELARIQRIEREEMDKDFSDAWKGAYDEYVDQMDQLKSSIALCASDIKMDERVKECKNKIEEIRRKELLFGLDDDNVAEFVKSITDLFEIRKSETVNERINGYRDLHRSIEVDLRNFGNYPSEWSYSAIKEPNTKLLEEIKGRVEELCNKSKPELKISVLNSQAIMNARSVKVEINVKNNEHRQTADAIDIEISCLDNEIKMEEMETFSSVESGEQDTYVMKFQLSENTIRRGNFKINVKVKYKYYINFMTSVDGEESAEFTINIINKAFKKIDNMYAKIVNGTGLKDYPEMFKGRKKLIDKLCASMDLGNGKMNTNRGIVLWGQRRVGKNSVKDHFKEQLKTQYPDAYIHIDIGSIGRLQNSFKNLLLIIVSSTEKEIRRHHKELFEYYKSAGLCELGKQIRTDENYVVLFGEYMQELMEVINEYSNPYTNIPLYYIDEFTYCYEWIMEGKVDGKEFMQFLKSFISDYGICAVLLAQDNMPVWKAEYPNEFNCMDFDNMISYLDKAGTQELVCEPCSIGGESRFNEESVDYIHDLTRGSAYLIDILCDQIIDYLNEAKEAEYVTKYTVENVLLSWIDGEKDFFEETVFEPQYQDTSKVGEDAKRVEEANKSLLSEISVGTKEREFIEKSELRFFEDNAYEFAEDVYERLVKRKVVVEEGSKCKLYMPLLKFMFLKKRGLMDKDALEYVD